MGVSHLKVANSRKVAKSLESRRFSLEFIVHHLVYYRPLSYIFAQPSAYARSSTYGTTRGADQVDPYIRNRALRTSFMALFQTQIAPRALPRLIPTNMRRTTVSLSLAVLCHLSSAIPWSTQNQYPFAPFSLPTESVTPADRQNAVKEAFLFAWNGYKTYSWGYDENRPVSNISSNSRYGWGATIVDSLDTLWLMGLKEEFALARKHVAKIDWRNTSGKHLVGAFETNIRYIGGLLSAYDLSDDRLFLDKAVELANLLLPIFDSPTGLPYQFVDFKSGRPVKSGFPHGASILAEIGSYQLEFTHISKLTGNRTYYDKVQRINDFFDGLRGTNKYPPGLFPILVDPDNGKFTSTQITYGGLGNSFYEYIIKQYILSGETNDQLLRLSLESVQSLEKYLLSSPVNRTDLVFLAHLEDGKQRHKMDELACFAPGTLLLFARALDLESTEDVARKLVNSCFRAWIATPTGITPESWHWVDPAKAETTLPKLTEEQRQQVKEWGFYVGSPSYGLRPGKLMCDGQLDENSDVVLRYVTL
ncbi:glycoside hydrolase [Jimgerdemannia flammicorona]|uniref:alpha-1,2-Mannosidase n=1 Tax=Jimgerdemannia flammicorona TaxID=994334 RepID=A0A433Q1Y8_9FUNG|nr:glycoside hydrolase [Jimgerdemannia flammicorona]